MVCPVFHFIYGNLMKVKVKVKSSSAYDCCRKNIYIFRIIRGTGMWYIGIPIKDSAIQKIRNHKPQTRYSADCCPIYLWLDDMAYERFAI